MQIKLICILCDTGGKVSYTFPSCVPVDFPASDANSAHSPLAEFCVPCVPSGTGPHSQPAHKTAQAPDLAPGGPVCPVYAPGGGTTRPRPVRGRFGPHRAQFGRKERKQPSPENNRQHKWRIRQLLTSHQANGFPKKSAVERGVKKEQVKGPGSPTGVPCRVTSPGRAGR